jgi:hypothetical protein
MSNNVYHRFTVNDKFETKVYTTPSVVAESGSTGWSGNMDSPSGTLSLYGGVRARTDVSSGSTSGLEVYPLDEVDTHSIDKIIQVTGSYPATGSIRVAYCTNTAPNFVSDITDVRWYQEHYRPIALLFDWYHNYVRASYTPMSDLSSAFRVVHVPSMFYGRQIATGTIKIIDRTILSGTYVDDGYGNLVISGTNAATAAASHSITNLVPYSEDLGNWFGSNGAMSATNVIAAPNGTMTADVMTDNAVAGVNHGMFRWIGTEPVVSGTKYTLSAYAKAREISKVYVAATNNSFNPNGLAWFNLVSGTYATESNCNAAGMTYAGNGWYRIWMTDTATASGTGTFFLQLTDPATGNRFYTGNGTNGVYFWGMQAEVGENVSDYVPTPGDATASLTVVSSGKMGNVFYNEGLIVFTRDLPYDLGKGPLAASDPKLHIEFSGSHIITSKIFMCRMHENECNCSRNPTWSTNVSGTLIRKSEDNTTYVTAVGIYNEDYELVAIAKLAQPIRKREKDRIDIRLRMDF